MHSEAKAMPERVVIRSEVDWTPYLAGVGIGILSWAVFALADDPLGITTAFAALSGIAAIPFLGIDGVWQNSYWAKTPPSLSYGSLFLLGVVLGALASAMATRRFSIETVPRLWRERFGPSILRRFAAAFGGGAVEMFGARLAEGCTSGHAISGNLQLALSSWLFTIVMAVSAAATALLLFGNRRSAQRGDATCHSL
jgi:uncharacterized membrane protein YedE/YeeE